MLHKICHISDLEHMPAKLPPQVLQAISNIVHILDTEYGETRDVVNDDGGHVLLAENAEDMTNAIVTYPFLASSEPEAVNNCSDDYINALFLLNNEFGINVIMPKKLAPSQWHKILD